MRSLIAAASLAGIALPAALTAQTPPAPRPMADGVLTRDEALARADRRFDAIDADHDGKISPAERAALPQRPRGTVDGVTPMPGRARGMGDRMLERANADKDGIVTREEFRAVAGRAFDRQDANHDGRVDAAERKQWRDQRMARRGGQPAE